MADYFDLPHLKYHAGRALEQTLNSSNSISTYRLAKTYHCEELARHTKEYVDLNFTNVAKTDEFLGLPYQDVKIWLSSDEINVNAEEDVFEIILRLTGYKIGERLKKYFAAFISNKGEALYRFRLPFTCLVQKQFSSPGKHVVDQCIRCLEVQMHWSRKNSASKFANYDLALRYWGRFARRNVSSSQNVPSGEEGGNGCFRKQRPT